MKFNNPSIPNYCPKCYGIWEVIERGEYKRIQWVRLKCQDCNHIFDNSPGDPDMLKGGKDYDIF